MALDLKQGGGGPDGEIRYGFGRIVHPENSRLLNEIEMTCVRALNGL